MRTEICTSPHRSADGAAWCGSRPTRDAELFLSGPAIVGLAFAPSKSLILATNNSTATAVDVGIEGRRSDVYRSTKSVHNAEIIAVGSELLTHDKVDTNSLFITEQLNALGVEVRRKLIVGDDRERLTAAVRHALDYARNRRDHRRPGPHRRRSDARRGGRRARPQADFQRGNSALGSRSAFACSIAKWRTSIDARRTWWKAPRCCPIRAAPRRASGSTSVAWSA